MAPGSRLALPCLLAFAAGLAATCGGAGGGPCDGVDCSGHGICFAVADASYCECAVGFHPVGTTCEANDVADPCLGIDCDGHGVCALEADDLPTCRCDPGYVQRLPLHCLPLLPSDADAATGEDGDAPDEAGEAETDVCVPDCAGRECGGDRCGGSCGSCGGGTTCSDGRCGCVPDCGGVECGDDGCGGSCGGCPTDYLCDSGHCLFYCNPPDIRPVDGRCLPSCGSVGGNWCPPRTCTELEVLDPHTYNCCPSDLLIETWDCREGDDEPENNYCCILP